MRINRIENYTSPLKNDCCPKPKNVHFGFGEDYGPDPSLEPEFNTPKSNPSTLKSLWYMVEIPAVIIKEAIEDRMLDRQAEKYYKAKFKEQERLKKEAELNKTVEGPQEIEEDEYCSGICNLDTVA